MSVNNSFVQFPEVLLKSHVCKIPEKLINTGWGGSPSRGDFTMSSPWLWWPICQAHLLNLGVENLPVMMLLFLWIPLVFSSLCRSILYWVVRWYAFVCACMQTDGCAFVNRNILSAFSHISCAHFFTVENISGWLSHTYFRRCALFLDNSFYQNAP